ncbi:PAS domain-containing sensor histidine kinase [Leptothoe sp. PORK10 BA2]|uniref:PAS domain-containing sensor histidine kinase n=1 Tax=Leptothoe sp. PORK10 BA2 TaxID=3110254 RepID=UPI002B2060AC|nr:ATP-binding protein [Leptothoe sp. PORK10 BA2]MEA5463140.1 ATP-binding protein [Leptothoe sp. PORK10 BA2]
MQEHDMSNELHTQIQYRLIEKLTESERRYRELVESLREIVFECDRNGCLIFLNKAWTEILGYSKQEALTQSLGDFILEADRIAWQAALQQQIESSLELRFKHQTGVVLWLELALRFSSDAKITGSLNNVTERKKAEILLKQANEQLEHRVQIRTRELSQANEQLITTLKKLQQAQGWLIQQEKMSSLGQMVAGVAHEINNPLSFIHGNLEHIQNYIQDLIGLVQQYQAYCPCPAPVIRAEAERIDLDFILADLPKILSSMKMGSDRICEIVLSLRNFSHLNESGIKAVNIHNELDNTLIILNHRLKANPKRSAIQVIKECADDLFPVECYAGLLNQVFMNILANAIDAIDDVEREADPQQLVKEGGHITLRTSLMDSKWVRISISDTGSGIPLAVQPQIFNPFFTTKSVGKGTGMGLAISYQIVTERHGGKLECFSSPGKGTEFVIQIPLQQTVI